MTDDTIVVGGETATIEYNFNITDAGDVRHMMLTAAQVAGRRAHQGDPDFKVIHNVLQAQADMVIKGLHVRDLEEAPDMMGDIVRFHQFFGQEYLGKPRDLKSEGKGDDTLYDFRVKFGKEELDEYIEVQEKLDDARARNDEDDIAKYLELQLDALVDQGYVLLGTAYLQFGAKIFNRAWARVHAANMKKVRADNAEEGAAESGRKPTFDIVKPKGWEAPDHTDLVADHAHRIYRQPGTVNPDEAQTRTM